MRSFRPINFLGMIDKKTGMVGDESHDLNGRRLAGSILVFPHGSGSSVGAYTIHSLHSQGVAPAAMICERADLTVATGCAVAGIPMAVATESEMGMLRAGSKALVDTDADILEVEP
jgi:hypothetical protein